MRFPSSTSGACLENAGYSSHTSLCQMQKMLNIQVILPLPDAHTILTVKSPLHLVSATFGANWAEGKPEAALPLFHNSFLASAPIPLNFCLCYVHYFQTKIISLKTR